MTTTVNDTRTIRFLGDNEITVVVAGSESGGAFSLMELVIQPRGGANALHTDRWIEVFHVLDGEVEWTLERDGSLDTWIARRGETIVVPAGAKHRFAGAGEAPCRMLTGGRPSTSSSSARWPRRGRGRSIARGRRRRWGRCSSGSGCECAWRRC